VLLNTYSHWIVRVIIFKCNESFTSFLLYYIKTSVNPVHNAQVCYFNNVWSPPPAPAVLYIFPIAAKHRFPLDHTRPEWFMWDQRGCSKKFYFKILNGPIIVWLLLQIFGVITMFWLPVLLQIPGVSLHLINDLGFTEFIGSGKRYPNCLTPSTNWFIYLKWTYSRNWGAREAS
jgi:hypothetical protein